VQECLLQFLGPNLQIWCTVQPLHQCTNAKMPQEEHKKCTLSIKMSPVARGGGVSPPWPGALPLDPARGFVQDPRNSHMVHFKLNCSLCSTIFYLKYTLPDPHHQGLCPRCTLCVRTTVLAMSVLTLQFSILVVCTWFWQLCRSAAWLSCFSHL